MEKEKKTRLREVSSKINMPKSITIGDPLYLERNTTECIYSKKFRGKSEWVGKLYLYEDEIEYEADKFFPDGLKVSDVYAKLYLANNMEMLDVINSGKRFATQKTQIINIAVDTAKYVLDIDGVCCTIDTGADGMWGYVLELYTNSKLDAIEIEIAFPTDMGETFEDHRHTLEAMFSCYLR